MRKHLLIVDLEATCFARGEEPAGFFSEIIEIGAVFFDTATNTVTRQYQSFVRPTLYPRLSAFCKQLTTISQDQVDAAPALADALDGLRALYDPAIAVFASWGFYDQRQIERTCARFDIPYPFAKAHISLKHNHAAFYHLPQPLGMDAALHYHGLELLGTHHRGLDDARNIASITACMLADGWTHKAMDRANGSPK